MIRISVITINYNNAAGLERTVKSVTGQKGPDVEFIVIDGGSTDESINIIKEYQNKITSWVSEKDKGIYHAQNKGIQKATGDYCLFLNSGDILADEFVLSKVSAEPGDAEIIYGDIITLNEKGVKNYLKSPLKLDVHHFMISTLWHPTAFIRRSVFNAIGMYREDFKVTGDYEFFIRAILKHNLSTKHINVTITIFDLSGISNTKEMAALQAEERKKSWRVNFSTIIIDAFETHTRLLRSREYKISKIVKRTLKLFSGKK